MDNLKKMIPHLLALAAGCFLVIMFFSPLFFENKTISQHDVQQGVDAAGEIIQYRNETGKEALWTNSMFGGMPAYLINIIWSGELLQHIQRIISIGFPSSAQVIFLSFVSFYILLISFGVRPLLAFAGAIAYSFNTFNMVSVEAGHIWKVRAIAYMPLVVAGVHLVFTHQKKLFALAVLSLGVGLEIMANHLQITYYLFIFLLIYGGYQLYLTIKSGQWKVFSQNVALLLLAAILGVGANAGRLWSTAEYSKYSTRGKTDLEKLSSAGDKGLDKDYVFNWSYGIQESLTLIIPNFSGGATTESLDFKSNMGKAMTNRNLPKNIAAQQLSNLPTYWGKQPFTSGPTYVGILVFFFVVMSFFWVDAQLRNGLLIAIALSLLLSWGKNLAWFNDFFYYYFPGYNKFRSVSMAMTILLLASPLLGFLAIEQFLRDDSEKKIKKLMTSFVIAGGATFLLMIIGKMMPFRGPVDEQLSNMPSWYMEALVADRRAMMINDAIRGFALIAAVFGLLYFNLKEKISLKVAGLGLVLLVIVDFWFVGKRFINEENYSRNPSKNRDLRTAADREILETGTGHYRVLNLINPFNEAATSSYHKSIGGYHGAKMKRYQELIDYCLSTEIKLLMSSLQNSTSRNVVGLNAQNMLNTQFFKFGDDARSVLPNEGAWGNAWFVNTLYPVYTADDELQATCGLPKKEAAVINYAKFIPTNPNPPSTDGMIRLTSYAPDRLVYKSDNSGDGFAVFSEIFYPEGWIATIDGQEAPIFQVNYVLRGLEIPKGQHEIIFEFKPKAYYTGNKITLVFSLLIIGLFVFALYVELKPKPAIGA